MEQSQLLLNGNTSVVLAEPRDMERPLFDVVMEFERKMLLKPAHQREFVWESAKVQAWIDRLAIATQDWARKPVGAIVTYQINDGKPSPRFINDGSQRIMATARVLQDPASYGYTYEQVEEILRAISIPVQHRWYKNEDDALVDFQLLNMGTSLTPREMCKGILTNHPAYRDVWNGLFQRVHEAMQSLSGGLIRNNRNENRELNHKFERHDLSLIVRWFADGTLTDHREVASSKLRKEQLDAKQTVENQLRDVCSNRPSEELRREIELLIRHIERQVALYRVVWDEVRQSAVGAALSVTAFRWLLDISIWARKNNISTTDWEAFVRDLLAFTQGTAVVQDKNNTRTRATLALGSVSKLKTVCRIINSDLYVGKLPRKRENKPVLPGFDNSHEVPFVTHGNGPTVIEPASRNRARGAKPISGKETL